MESGHVDAGPITQQEITKKEMKKMFDLRKFRTLGVLFLACVLALIVAAPYAGAQQLSGTVRGQVKDSTGASIPAADVTVSGGSGFSKTLSTDEQGVFSV